MSRNLLKVAANRALNIREYGSARAPYIIHSRPGRIRTYLALARGIFMKNACKNAVYKKGTAEGP